MQHSPAPRAVYSLRNVSKTYARGAIRALEPVDLTLEEGTFSSVIGPSGCGKSTLLKIMAGLAPPSAGSVMLENTPVTGARNEIGMMFQHATLFPWRTVVQNVLLPLEVQQGANAARLATGKAEELLKLVGLGDFCNAYPDQLSGGMAQRAAICRMLITEPHVLLLDEPFSALDELAREHMHQELQRICASRNATSFLITHSIPEAVLLSDVVYVMSPRPGRIIRRIEIDLPRPRKPDVMLDPASHEYVTAIRQLLDEGASL